MIEDFEGGALEPESPEDKPTIKAEKPFSERRQHQELRGVQIPAGFEVASDTRFAEAYTNVLQGPLAFITEAKEKEILNDTRAMQSLYIEYLDMDEKFFELPTYAEYFARLAVEKFGKSEPQYRLIQRICEHVVANSDLDKINLVDDKILELRTALTLSSLDVELAEKLTKEILAEIRRKVPKESPQAVSPEIKDSVTKAIDEAWGDQGHDS